jgi:hypothetical protein
VSGSPASPGLARSEEPELGAASIQGFGSRHGLVSRAVCQARSLSCAPARPRSWGSLRWRRPSSSRREPLQMLHCGTRRTPARCAANVRRFRVARSQEKEKAMKMRRFHSAVVMAAAISLVAGAAEARGGGGSHSGGGARAGSTMGSGAMCHSRSRPPKPLDRLGR